MTNPTRKSQGVTPDTDKLSLIRELRSDAEFLSGVKRGLEARRRGDRLHWDDVKAELNIK